MKFKRGQLATVTFGNISAACIVLGREPGAEVTTLSHNTWYKVYMIEQQRTTYLRQYVLSPMNPQVSESEV